MTILFSNFQKVIFDMNRKSILIFEDNTEIRAITKFSLEMDGYWQVAVANCSKEGLLTAKTINPDVILLDAIALNTEEVEILSQLRIDKTTRNIPIVLFTTFLGILYLLRFQPVLMVLLCFF